MTATATASPPARPKLVPTSVLSAHLGVSDHTTRRLAREGMPHVKVGTKLYFDLAKADAYLDRLADTVPALEALNVAKADPYLEAIKKLVDAAPELTSEQAAKIKAVLST